MKIKSFYTALKLLITWILSYIIQLLNRIFIKLNNFVFQKQLLLKNKKQKITTRVVHDTDEIKNKRSYI